MKITTAVSTPTGAGVSATTLSTTTTNGTTTALVRAGAGVVVVGAAATTGYRIWHYWGEAQNEQAQEKARQKYCAANPGDDICLPPFTGGQSPGVVYEVWVGATPFNDAADDTYNEVRYARFHILGPFVNYRIEPI